MNRASPSIACEGNYRQNERVALTNADHTYSRLIYEVLNGRPVEGCILMHPSCNATRCDATRRNDAASLVPGNSKCCTIMRRSRFALKIVLNDTAPCRCTSRCPNNSIYILLPLSTAAVAFRARDRAFVMAYFRHAKLQSRLPPKLASIFTLRYTERNHARRPASSRRVKNVE